MKLQIPQEKQRQRAPSKRALETKRAILDAAERLFAARGFDGTSIRDIGKEAGVQTSLVHHHGGGKEALFARVVARRADELSIARLSALAAHNHQRGPATLEGILAAFFGPYLEKAEAAGPQWHAYARLVAIVSADPQWKNLTERCFDPTAGHFIDAIAGLFPHASRDDIAVGFVYSVSAMLALATSRWRVSALGNNPKDMADYLDELIRFCAAGITAAATPPKNAP
ncbi:MAG: TetR family transcriptional regulator [Rhodobacteraceae bacterium]|nr:TetR family transcriptional regulator [Paracoccaceae bacterium]MCW9044659.1 TetR family transcriptional regulator [Pseudopelagicola sp.]